MIVQHIHCRFLEAQCMDQFNKRARVLGDIAIHLHDLLDVDTKLRHGLVCIEATQEVIYFMENG